MISNEVRESTLTVLKKLAELLDEIDVWVRQVRSVSVPSLTDRPSTKEEWTYNSICAFISLLKNGELDLILQEILASRFSLKLLREVRNIEAISDELIETFSSTRNTSFYSIEKTRKIFQRLVEETDEGLEAVSSGPTSRFIIETASDIFKGMDGPGVWAIVTSIDPKEVGEDLKDRFVKKNGPDTDFISITNLLIGFGIRKANAVGRAAETMHRLFAEELKEAILAKENIKERLKKWGEEELRKRPHFKFYSQTAEYFIGKSETNRLDNEKYLASAINDWTNFINGVKFTGLGSLIAATLISNGIFSKDMLTEKVKNLIESNYKEGLDKDIERAKSQLDNFGSLFELDRTSLSYSGAKFFMSKENAERAMGEGKKGEAVKSLAEGYFQFKDELLISKRQDVIANVLHQRLSFGGVRNLHRALDVFEVKKELLSIHDKIKEMSRAVNDENGLDMLTDAISLTHEYIDNAKKIIGNKTGHRGQSTIVLIQSKIDICNARYSQGEIKNKKDVKDCMALLLRATSQAGLATESSRYLTQLPLSEVAKVAEEISRREIKNAVNELDYTARSADRLMNIVSILHGGSHSAKEKLFFYDVLNQQKYKIDETTPREERVKKAQMIVDDFLQLMQEGVFDNDDYRKEIIRWAPHVIFNAPTFKQGIKIANALYESYHNVSESEEINLTRREENDALSIGKHPDAIKTTISATIKKYFEMYLALSKLEADYGEGLNFEKTVKEVTGKFGVSGGWDSVSRILSNIRNGKKIEDISTAKKDIKVAELTINIVNSSASTRYFKYVEQKDPKITSFPNWESPNNGFRFRALEQGDLRHFTIGVETDCCQILGGVGEAAAVDSFINKYAGVLLLELRVNDDWEVAFQSYFHYVPEDNGYILDNIEGNEKIYNRTQSVTGYSPEELYALWAKEMKSKDSDIKYILLGKAYTVINTSNFANYSMERDPRTFSESLDDFNLNPYSDWNPENSADLLGVDRVIEKGSSYSHLTSNDVFDGSLFDTICGVETTDQVMIRLDLGKPKTYSFKAFPSLERIEDLDKFTLNLKSYLIAFANDAGMNTVGWEKKKINWIEGQVFGRRKAWIDFAMVKVARANIYVRKYLGVINA